MTDPGELVMCSPRTLNRVKLSGVFFVLCIAVAHAHDWYPMECCHQMDCAPVDEASSSMLFQGGVLSLAPMTIKTRHGEVVVPPNFPARQSKDGRMHACIREGRLVCLFMPPVM